MRSQDAQRVYVARTYAYVARRQARAGHRRCRAPGAHASCEQLLQRRRQTERRRDVVVASTNASLFAYVADGARRTEGAAAHFTRPASRSSMASARSRSRS